MFQSLAKVALRRGVGNDENTIVLLHADGANGTNVFPDVNAGGVPNRVWTPQNTVQNSTDQQQFGPASIRNTRTALDRVRTVFTAEMNPRLNGLTMDYWIFFRTAGIVQNMGGWGNVDADNAESQMYFQTLADGTLRANFASLGNIEILATAPGFYEINRWYHLAGTYNHLTRFCEFFIDGVSIGGGATLPGEMNVSSSNLAIGVLGDFLTNPADAYFDEYRISNNVRFVGGFTPADEPYGPPQTDP